MLLADMDPAVVAFFVAMTPFVVILTTILQSRYDQWVARKKKEADDEAAAKKAAADKAALDATARTLAAKTEQTAQAITHEVKTVQKAVNGEGIGGKLDAVIAEQQRQGEEQRRQAAWQVAHDAQDNQRHDDTIARFVGLRRAGPEDKA